MPAPALTIVPIDPDRAAWSTEVESYLGVMRSRRRSPHTLRGYRNSLEAWAAWRTDQGLPLDPVLATRREALAWASHLSSTYAPGTAATRMVALGSFFRWMVDEWAIGGDVRSNPFDRVSPPKVPQARVPVLTDHQVDRLLAACRGTTFEDLRDRAILALMTSAGLRRSEVAALLVEDVEGDLVRVQEGKGETDAVVPFGQVAQDALRHYMRARAHHRDADRVESVGLRTDRLRLGRPLFLVSVASGRRGGLSAQSLPGILDRRAAAAGLGHIHLHQLRHTFAHGLLAAGVQEGDVMALGRWKSRAMLDRYGADLRQERARIAYRDPLARGADKVTRTR